VCQLVATIAKTANVTLVPPAADETLRIAADDGQLTQVLTNLVVNGIQATPPGGTVSLAATFVEQAAPPYVESDEQAWMAIAVTDTGIGLEEAHRARIFEPFF